MTENRLVCASLYREEMSRMLFFEHSYTPFLKCKYFSFDRVHKTDAILFIISGNYVNLRQKIHQTLYMPSACKFRSLASLLYSTYG